MITDVVLARTWYNINAHNNRLYFRVYSDNNNTFNDYSITIKPQNYTIFSLAQSLETAINEASNKVFQLEANTNTGTIIFTLVSQTISGLRVLTNDELITRVSSSWNGNFYNINNLMSLNNIIKNFGTSRINDNTDKYETGLVDLLGLHNIYIKSSILSNFSNMGPTGERDIVSKIITNAMYGDVIIYHNYLSEDYVDVSNRTLKNVDFRITDVNNNLLELNGSNISFSLLFMSTRNK